MIMSLHRRLPAPFAPHRRCTEQADRYWPAQTATSPAATPVAYRRPARVGRAYGAGQ